MMRNLKVLKTGLTTVGLVAALSACGQGPHLVGPKTVPANDAGQVEAGPGPGHGHGHPNPRISPIIDPAPSGTPSGTPSGGPSAGPVGSGPAVDPAIGVPTVLVPTVVTTVVTTIGPGPVAPGTTAPGTTAPGTTAPGTTAPGTTAPGTTAPGTTAPGTTAPGTGSTDQTGGNGTGVVTARDGRDGQNGANGQNGRDGCGSRLFSARFPARPMSAEELRGAELPYRSTSAIKIPVHQIGDSNHQTRNGIKYVRDAQLVFAVDATLPFKASVVSLKEFSIEMAVSKLPTEVQRGHAIYLDTEILCLLDAKRCSGKLYTDRDFLPNINPLFFGSNGKVSSDVFTKLVLENATTVPGLTQKLYSSDSARVDLKAAFPDVTMADYLYGDSRPSEDPRFVDRVLRLAVADDTFVSSATVSVKMIVNTCMDPQAK